MALSVKTVIGLVIIFNLITFSAFFFLGSNIEPLSDQSSLCNYLFSHLSILLSILPPQPQHSNSYSQPQENESINGQRNPSIISFKSIKRLLIKVISLRNDLVVDLSTSQTQILTLMTKISLILIKISRLEEISHRLIPTTIKLFNRVIWMTKQTITPLIKQIKQLRQTMTTPTIKQMIM